MAPETKVGLVVGLGFIICFAVILANRGRKEPTTTYLTNFGESSRPEVNSNNAGSDASDDRTPPMQEASIGFSAQRPQRMVPMRLDQNEFVNPDGGAFAPANRAADEASSGHVETQYQHQPGDSSELYAQPESERQYVDGQTSGPQSISYPNTAAENLANYPARDHSSGIGEAVSASTVRHKVSKGETLSKIAARYFGRSSNSSVHAIFEANRHVLKNPNVLRIGVELVIPNVAQGKVKAPDATKRKRTTDPINTKRRSAEPSGTRWYQIKKQDRYISIARRELGDASRWQEIHELNKEKFPDPSRIRPGVRIRLPDRTFASQGGV